MAKTLPAGLDASILCDSITPDGNRLTSFRLTVPKTSLQDLAKHRIDTMGGWEDASMSAASARAIPTAKLLESDRRWVPPRFFLAHTGMVPTEWVGPDSETVDERAHYEALKNEWETAASDAEQHAERMAQGGAAKVHPNRVLEPYLLADVIYTASSRSIENMLNLRDTDEAEYPLALVAGKMRALLDENEPKILHTGGWHRPMMVERDSDLLNVRPDIISAWALQAGFTDEEWRDCCASSSVHTAALNMVSSARCARISFNRHDLILPVKDDLKRALQLGRDAHMVPFEHQALVGRGDEPAGMFRSNFGDPWIQYRRTLPFNRLPSRQTTPTPYERLAQ